MRDKDEVMGETNESVREGSQSDLLCSEVAVPEGDCSLVSNSQAVFEASLVYFLFCLNYTNERKLLLVS
jgi:hypothetical protein